MTSNGKNKGGRPRGGKGREPMVSVRFPRALLEELDALAKAQGKDRSTVVRSFVEAGLHSAKA